MTIRSMPNTDAYRDGWDRVFKGKRIVEETPEETQERGEPVWAAHPDVVRVLQTETCQPCNEEHPRGEPCPKCGRSLLLG